MTFSQFNLVVAATIDRLRAKVIAAFYSLSRWAMECPYK